MPALTANLILVGNWDTQWADRGALILSDFSEIEKVNEQARIKTIVLSITQVLGKKFPSLIEKIRAHSPSVKLIPIIPQGFSTEKILELHTQYSFFQIFSSQIDPDLESGIRRAIERSDLDEQDESLFQLIREQERTIQSLQKDLEERVSRRKKELVEARRKLYTTNLRNEHFKEALLSIFQATNLSELEDLLNKALSPAIMTSWVKIVFYPQDEANTLQLENSGDFAIYRLPLTYQERPLGSAFFLRPPHAKFLKSETSLIESLSEALSLAALRLSRLKESELVKEQWEATFQSLPDQLALIDSQFNVVKSNKVTPFNGTKCYERFFGRTAPCEQCQKGHQFRLTDQKTYDVYSHKISLPGPQPLSGFLNQYHDITNQLLLEKKLLESAKATEIATIGSSIAHELNNPLGGLLSFAQLIKMDLKADDPLYAEVTEIEVGARRCRDIVQNLLGFMRNSQEESKSQFSYIDPLQRAIQIVQIQAQSLGLQIRVFDESNGQLMNGFLNQLTQAYCNCIQDAIDRIKQKKTVQKNYQGVLEINIKNSNQQVLVTIIDDGMTADPSLPTTLRLQVSRQIFSDHSGKLDLKTSPVMFNQAIISFTRPVLTS